ncbi:Cuticlin-1 [Amphibalanus amphitrite]|uniref:Cuticlin-1 n=1 Tax=Amphibalanus amphitrite TaxID=1232801 RepID=A0A6A4XA45_AMPAM|nr:Cuticlin-1 [Amphibalanus amphitrite]
MRFVLAAASLTTALKPPLKVRSPVEDIRIECSSNDIEVSIFTNQEFNGMVYPKGLAKNSTCMTEYTGQGSPVRYRLSLRSCNTMGVQQDDTIEYFNTIVVQPHRKLVTNQGRGFHVRCKYQTRDKADIETKRRQTIASTQPGRRGASLKRSAEVTAPTRPSEYW